MAFDVVPRQGPGRTVDDHVRLRPHARHSTRFLVPPGTSVQAGGGTAPARRPGADPDPQRGLRRARPPDPAARHRHLHRPGSAGGSSSASGTWTCRPPRPRRRAPPRSGRSLNLTGDTHPIHFHLVNVQITGAAALQSGGLLQTATAPGATTGTLTFTGPARTGPERAGLEGNRPDEPRRGHEGDHEVRPADRARPVPYQPCPASPRTGGHEYVWHCHILEHEEHDMMRPAGGHLLRARILPEPIKKGRKPGPGAPAPGPLCKPRDSGGAVFLSQWLLY